MRLAADRHVGIFAVRRVVRILVRRGISGVAATDAIAVCILVAISMRMSRNLLDG